MRPGVVAAGLDRVGHEKMPALRQRSRAATRMHKAAVEGVQRASHDRVSNVRAQGMLDGGDDEWRLLRLSVFSVQLDE